MIYWSKWEGYFNIILENPLKTWWKAKKYFKFPTISWRFSTKNWNTPYANLKWRGKILDINIRDLSWKDKWNSPRHEINPYIYICLFNKYSLSIMFTAKFIDEFGFKRDYSMEYWEYMLDYLYYSKSLKLNSWWETNSDIFSTVVEYGDEENGTEDKRKPMKLPVPTHLFSLNKKGLKEFKKLYD